MKKLLAVGILFLSCFTLCGCFKRDDLEDITIYTTVYPIQYLTEVLYGYNSTVLSIYPDGVDISDYSLTDKKIKEYSSEPIFVYNGLSNEKEIARNFINQNDNLRIIDVSYGLKYTYSTEELWLAPNNYLMLATTIKNNLQEFISNKYIQDEIEENYKPFLEEVSLMDASLRSLGSTAKSKKSEVLIVSSNALKYLNEYGFEVISLEDEVNNTKDAKEVIEAKFKNGTYKYIITRTDESKSDFVTNLITNYKAKEVTYDVMNTISEEQRKNKATYISIMNENIDKIRNIVLEEKEEDE